MNEAERPRLVDVDREAIATARVRAEGEAAMERRRRSGLVLLAVLLLIAIYWLLRLFA